MTTAEKAIEVFASMTKQPRCRACNVPLVEIDGWFPNHCPKCARERYDLGHLDYLDQFEYADKS